MLQYWFTSGDYWELAQSRGAGTTRSRLNTKTLSGFPLLVATDLTANQFADVVHVIRSRVVADTVEMKVVAAWQDALLPKLVLGDLQVGKTGGQSLNEHA